jgi:hypothetical protein
LPEATRCLALGFKPARRFTDTFRGHIIEYGSKCTSTRCLTLLYLGPQTTSLSVRGNWCPPRAQQKRVSEATLPMVSTLRVFLPILRTAESPPSSATADESRSRSARNQKNRLRRLKHFSGDKVTHYIEISSIQNYVNKELVRRVKFQGDQIILITPPTPVNGKVQTVELVWQRLSVG